MGSKSGVITKERGYVPLPVAEIKAMLSKKGWTNRALAARWGFSDEYVSKIINNPKRKPHFDDAIVGLRRFPG